MAKFGFILGALVIAFGVAGLSVLVNGALPGILPTPDFNYFLLIFGSAILLGVVAGFFRAIPSSIFFGIITVIVSTIFFGLAFDLVAITTMIVVNTVVFFAVANVIRMGAPQATRLA